METDFQRRVSTLVLGAALLLVVCAFFELGSRGVEMMRSQDRPSEVAPRASMDATSTDPWEDLEHARVSDRRRWPIVPGSRSEASDAGVKPRSKMSMDLLAAIDAGSNPTHRVILQVGKGPGQDTTELREAMRQRAGELGGTVVRDIPLIGAVVLDLPTDGVLALAGDTSVARLSLDAKVQGAMTVERAAVGGDLIGADDGTGYDGRGVVVVVIDSGVHFMHDDFQCAAEMPGSQKNPIYNAADDIDGGLEARWNGEVKQRHNRRVISIDFTNPSKNGEDDYGHGTHVAGIVAGSGREAWEHSSISQHRGIAPASTILSLRVLDSEGAGFTSDVIAAISFVVSNQDVIDAKVMNLSLGHPVYESYETDPLALACAAAVDAGVTVVCSAGNHGSSATGSAYGTITSPAHAPWVITVGASNTGGTVPRSDDTIATFSSRGPTPIDGMVKPDIVAPGVSVIASGLEDSTLNERYAMMVDIGNNCDNDYMAMSGTSMSAGFVSGALACMFQANPSLTPNAAKAILMYTAQKMTLPNVLEQGAGLLNVEGAVRLSAAIAPNSDSLPEGAFWLDAASPEEAIGMLDPYTPIGGEVAYWGSALIWGDGYLWGGGIGTGNTVVWGDGFLWDDVLNWANGFLWFDALVSNKQDVFGECFLWFTGCSGSGGSGDGGDGGGVGGSGFTWGGAGTGVVNGNSFLWTSQPMPGGTYDTWSEAFANPMSIVPDDQESVLAAGENHDPSRLEFGQPGDWFFPRKNVVK